MWHVWCWKSRKSDDRNWKSESVRIRVSYGSLLISVGNRNAILQSKMRYFSRRPLPDAWRDKFAETVQQLCCTQDRECDLSLYVLLQCQPAQRKDKFHWKFCPHRYKFIATSFSCCFTALQEFPSRYILDVTLPYVPMSYRSSSPLKLSDQTL
jgi:hypothetical protein